MLAFLASLSDDKETIRLPISENHDLVLAVETVRFKASFDYDEPKSNGRLVPIDWVDEGDEDELDDFNDGDEINESEDGADPKEI